MNERKRRSVIRKLAPHAPKEGSQEFGGTLYLRPLAEDDAAIDEIAKATGEKRSRIAQKLISAGLAGTGFKPDAERKLPERVEWLVHQEKRRHFRDEETAARLERIEEDLRESKLLISAATAQSRSQRMLAAETYCLAGVAVAYLGQLFAAAPPLEREPSMTERKRTDLNALTLVEYALGELERLKSHHDAKGDAAPGDEAEESLYFATKVGKLRARLAGLVGAATGGEEDRKA